MTAVAPPVCATPSHLFEQAKANFARNTAAMDCAMELPALDFMYGRDGSLTAKRDGAWLGGCSVPRRAAELMLRSLVVRGNLACLAMPTHAHQVAVCVERIDRGTGLVVLLDDQQRRAEFLACADFADAIDAGRAFFVVGMDELRELFARFPGLPVPQQFVRVSAASGEACDAIMRAAQGLFSEIAREQQDRLARVHRAAHASQRSQTLAVLAPLQFRLWNDAGFALASLIPGTVINPEDPRESAVAHVAEVAAARRALVSVDVARADRPELAQAGQPWIAWITQARVPAFVTTSPQDGLVLCDDSLRPTALRAGWPAKRIAIAPAPSGEANLVLMRESIGARDGASTIQLPPNQRPRERDRIALILDLPDLAPPDAVKDFSSWRLVWEAIEQELTENPTKLGSEAAKYLDRVLTRQGIADKNLPRPLFIERLIVPAFAIGVARLLVRENVPVALHGSGWDRVAGLTEFARGPVVTRDAFNDALSDAAAVVDVFVTHPVHPVHTCGRTVIRTGGATALRIVQDARFALTASPPAAPPAGTLASAIDTLLG